MTGAAHHGGRQPVHTLYLPADRFDARAVPAAGAEAARLLARHAPDAAALAAAVDLDDADLAAAVRRRVAAKLATEPVEDLRVDFEDGYGGGAAAEDGHASAAGAAAAEAWAVGSLPRRWGVRVKPFCDGLADRSVRTLERVLAALLERAGRLPPGFTVTFPKIMAVEHVAAFAGTCARLEGEHGLEPGSLRFEIQVETTASLVAPDGRLALPRIVAAADGRLEAACFGVYDYTAALGLPPEEQRLDHPACDAARHVMQQCLAGTGVWLADGSTNAVPAADEAGELRRVWRRHAADVRHSLRHGFRQGWDLHPSHLVSRFATVYAHALDGLDEVCARLGRAYAGAGGAAGAGGVLDEPATVRMLLERLRHAVACGAITAEEACARAGLDPTVLDPPSDGG